MRDNKNFFLYISTQYTVLVKLLEPSYQTTH